MAACKPCVFTLENGFDGFNGSLQQGGLLFGRQAFVGLSSNTWGALTMGRQYDSIVDFAQPFTLNGNTGGLYFSHPNDMDNTDNGFRVDKTIKYTSIDYKGFKFGGLYSFGGTPGKFHNNSVWSLGAGYNNGPLALGVAYLKVNDPQTAVAGYQNGGGFTNVIYGNFLPSASSQNIFGVGGSYAFGPATAMVDYNFSKRTDVYAMAAYQRAARDAQLAQIAGFDASTNNKQFIWRVASISATRCAPR